MRNGRPPSHNTAIWVANIMDEHNPRLAPGVRAYDVRIPNIIHQDSDDDETSQAQRETLYKALAQYRLREYYHDRILMEIEHWNPDNMTWHEQPEAPEIAPTDMLYEDPGKPKVTFFQLTPFKLFYSFYRLANFLNASQKIL